MMRTMILSITEFARLGGKARAQKMTKEERRQSAKKAVEARWAEHKKLMKQSDKNLSKLEKQSEKLVADSSALLKSNRARKRKAEK